MTPLPEHQPQEREDSIEMSEASSLSLEEQQSSLKTSDENVKDTMPVDKPEASDTAQAVLVIPQEHLNDDKDGSSSVYGLKKTVTTATPCGTGSTITEHRETSDKVDTVQLKGGATLYTAQQSQESPATMTHHQSDKQKPSLVSIETESSILLPSNDSVPSLTESTVTANNEEHSVIGKNVTTPDGVGTASDEARVVERNNAALYTNNSYCVAVERQEESVQAEQKSEQSVKSKAAPMRSSDPTAVLTATKISPDRPKFVKKHSTTMELDVAYQALEKMRVLNLEMECFERGVEGPIDSHQCTKCLLTHQILQPKERFPRLQKFVDNTKSEEKTRFPRVQKTIWGGRKNQEKTVVLPRIQRLMDQHRRALASPCLICAAPSCSNHSSAVFRKEKITLCHSCECFFQLEFISDCVSNPNSTERAKHVDRMIDLYDRSLLLLRYSAQYINEVALALEQNTEKQNKIGLGSSSAGIVSGALGIAAAATILTPAGPPLLVASLLFGGSATVVQTGTEAMNYYSEPSKLADRVIALHGISKSLLRVTGTLRDVIARHGRVIESEETNEDSSVTVQERVQENYVKNRQGLVAASTVGRTITLGSAAGSAAEVGAIGGARSATALSRAGTAAARTARFARFAGGALSAAVLVMEANAIQSTMTQIRAGNPCEKAETLRKILKELEEFPSTDTLDGECRAYLETLERPVKIVKDEDQFCQPGATILDGEDPESMEQGAASSDSKLLRSSAAAAGGRSLIERIKMHKDRQSSTGSDNADSPGVQDQGLRDLDLNLIS